MSTKKALMAAAVAALSLTLGTEVQAQAQEPYVKLSNQYTGFLFALDLGNRLNPNILSGEMAAEGPAWGQFWSFVRAPDGFFRVHNRLAPGMCLDVAGDGVIYMDTCGNQIGQRWDVRGQNGDVNFINQFKPGQCLDVTNNAPNVAMMAPCSTVTGQRWTVTPTAVWP